MDNLEKTIEEILKHHLKTILEDKNIHNFNYNDLGDLKDDLMHSISLYNSKITK